MDDLLTRVRSIQETWTELEAELANDVFFDPQTEEEQTKIDRLMAAIEAHHHAITQVKV